MVVCVIYTLIRVFIPNRFKMLPLWIFIFSTFVEFMQYINVISILGLENNVFFRTLIGTSFSWIDMICYLIGCIPLGIFKYLKNRK